MLTDLAARGRDLTRFWPACLAALRIGVTDLIALPYGEELIRCATAAWRRGRR